MLVELTPRSAEIIAREQKERGAISPEHLIEQALEIMQDRVAEPSWFHASEEEQHRMLLQGIADVENGRVHSLDDVLREMDEIIHQPEHVD